MNDSTRNQRDEVQTGQLSLSKEPWKWPLAYTMVITLFALTGLIAILHFIEQYQTNQRFPLTLLVVLVLMAGAIGGCLFNIYSLVKHLDRGDFKIKYTIGYYLCPISGAVCGLIVVILLLGGVLTLGLGEDAEQVVLTYPGRLMPFIAAAIIAGYGSRQFKKKLDELADTFFRTDEKKVTTGQEENSPQGSFGGGDTASVSLDRDEDEKSRTQMTCHSA